MMKPKRLVMIPGPTPVVSGIREQMGREVAGYGDPDFVSDYKSVIEDLKAMFRTKGEVFVVAGSGTLAMEMAISNTTKRDDNVLIVSHGFFGDRFIDLCKRKGLNVDVLASEWGDVVPVSEIEKKLCEKNYAAVTVTHVDTSTGVRAEIKEIGAMLKKFPDTIYIVDGVCATGAEIEYVDDFGIDVLFTASQKAFGVSSGLYMLWAGEKALERRKSLGIIPEFYVDFDKWQPIMDNPAKYFATPAINLVWALKESVRIMKEEGLEERYLRHEKNSHAIRSGLSAIGFKVLAKEPYRAVTLSNLIYPEGLDDATFRAKALEEGVLVAGGLGPYVGKMFRFGHMGNVDIHELIATLAAIERALFKSGYKDFDFGKSVGVFQREIVL
ncbi:MAG: alanine--glyoxylate aminotransferase family protein [Oscillospiraceae bacterium]|nr:alanine--glyoxylate aminotransferase family protein [Oscillospiraceae bacterium]